jgi:hypothetical protein
MLEPTPALPVVPVVEPCPPSPPSPPSPPGLDALIADAARLVEQAAAASLGTLDDGALGVAVAGVARLESRAAALRMALSAEAERRRVAEATAETGTDAWVARLTGSTREQAASGLRIAGLLQDRYAATRAAFAAGDLRPDQVRVIVNAAEQAPVEATPAQVRAAEEWLVGKATGAGNRNGRPHDATRLRQTARRMFACVDWELAARHEAILLGRETRTAQAETFLALHDNGDGSFSGRFRIPELHGHLLKATLDRLCAPRRLGRDRNGDLVVDESAIGHNNGASIYETHGAAWCELIEHLPTTGWPGHGGNGCEIIVKIDLDTLLTGLDGLGTTGLGGIGSAQLGGVGGVEDGVAITAGEARRKPLSADAEPRDRPSPCHPRLTARPADAMGRRKSSAWRRRDATPRRARPATRRTQPPHRIFEPRAPATTDDVHQHHHRRAHDTRFHLHQRPDGDWTLRPRR